MENPLLQRQGRESNYADVFDRIQLEQLTRLWSSSTTARVRKYPQGEGKAQPAGTQLARSVLLKGREPVQ